MLKLLSLFGERFFAEQYPITSQRQSWSENGEMENGRLNQQRSILYTIFIFSSIVLASYIDCLGDKQDSPKAILHPSVLQMQLPILQTLNWSLLQQFISISSTSLCFFKLILEDIFLHSSLNIWGVGTFGTMLLCWRDGNYESGHT